MRKRSTSSTSPAAEREEEAVKDMAVGALAYDTVPLGQLGTLEPFDPNFQSLAVDKGGMVFHMLRWVIGEQNFDKACAQLRMSSSRASRLAWTILKNSRTKFPAKS